MAFLTDTFSAQGSLTEKLSMLVQDFKASMAQRAVYRATVNELSALSDRELADLGMARCMIRRIALETAYKA